MKSLLFTCALMLAAPAAFPSTQQTPPGIPDALRIQAQDPAGAAKILEDVTTREPKNGRAWRLLGVALQQSKEPDRAIEAFMKALALGPDPGAAYNIGTAYARKNDLDKAFEWLAQAKASRFDMTQMQVDPALEPLRKDPRYTALLPAKEDFANPFVEKTRILGE